ncbi:unnamed protein product, partial [Didymodactylos carnosus]
MNKSQKNKEFKHLPVHGPAEYRPIYIHKSTIENCYDVKRLIQKSQMFCIDIESIVAAFNDRIKAENQQNHPALIQVAEKLFCGEPKDEMTSLKVHYKNNLFHRGELKAIFHIRELFHEKIRYEGKTGKRLLEQESSVFSAVPGALVVDNSDDDCFNSNAVVQP